MRRQMAKVVNLFETGSWRCSKLIYAARRCVVSLYLKSRSSSGKMIRIGYYRLVDRIYNRVYSSLILTTVVYPNVGYCG
jgi:hypothetical protein